MRIRGGEETQISRQSTHEVGKVISPTHRPSLPLRIYSWYSFLLEAESTPGPQCDQKGYVNEKSEWHHRESNLHRAKVFKFQTDPVFLYSSIQKELSVAFRCKLII